MSSSSDEEFAVGSLSEEELEKLMEAIDERKKLIATLRAQPWPMHKKMSMLRSITYITVYTQLWFYPNPLHTNIPSFIHVCGHTTHSLCSKDVSFMGS